MDQNDKQAIEGLFGKLAQVERQSPGRDAQAEAFIAQAVAQQPGAPYFMAQTIVVQEHALNAAQERIAQLEAEAEAARQQAPAQGGGIFGRMFGGGQPAPAPAARRPQPQPAYQQPMQPAPAQGGGFLAGAAQTAMGVAGGVLLANAIGGMFGGDEAQAAEAPAEEEPPVEEFEEDSADDGGDFGSDDE